MIVGVKVNNIQGKLRKKCVQRAVRHGLVDNFVISSSPFGSLNKFEFIIFLG
jgi:hypothetical protein